MRRNAHVRFGGRAEETDGWKHPHGASVRPYTYVLTREGWMYVSFLQDAFSRRILGFVVAASKTAELVTRTLLQAVNVRQRSDATFVADGVILHSDAGSQYTSLAFTEKLLDLGLTPSIGRVGTAYDKAWASYCTPLRRLGRLWGFGSVGELLSLSFRGCGGGVGALV